jgi:hypothetical protein
VDHGGAVLPLALDRVGGDDGIGGRGLDRGLYRLAVRTLGETDLPQVDLVAAALELEDGVADLRASPTTAARPLGDLGAPEEEAAEFVLGDLEVDLVLVAMNREDAGLGRVVLGNNVVVLLEFAGLAGGRFAAALRQRELALLFGGILSEARGWVGDEHRTQKGAEQQSGSHDTPWDG